ncbi:conserved hypothetical protein [Paenibacillus curdlanolyticus YK9]|uniref:Uncharacterized protein n=1 Tax=Paenibacillus curdlanolyticus YK9 TaxID=717606 RepID=E0I686_9BACL|nr:conserved hypothetical protein [Paenibacillus curdlanolyticus YK9]
MMGVEMLAIYFSKAEVNVSLIGSVLNSDYFQQQLTSKLSEGKNKMYKLTKPAFPPVAGAVLLALKQLNLPIEEELMTNLSQYDVIC